MQLQRTQLSAIWQYVSSETTWGDTERRLLRGCSSPQHHECFRSLSGLITSLISLMHTDSFKPNLKYSVRTFVNRHLLLLHLFLLHVGSVSSGTHIPSESRRSWALPPLLKMKYETLEVLTAVSCKDFCFVLLKNFSWSPTYTALAQNLASVQIALPTGIWESVTSACQPTLLFPPSQCWAGCFPKPSVHFIL